MATAVELTTGGTSVADFNGSIATVGPQSSVAPDLTFTVSASAATVSTINLPTLGGITPADYNSLAGISTGATTYHRKRAKDSAGPGPDPTYVYWTTTDPSAPYPGTPPFGGPLVDEVIIETFQQ